MSQPQTVIMNRPQGTIVSRATGQTIAVSGTPMIMNSSIQQQQVLRVQSPGMQSSLSVNRPTAVPTIPSAAMQGRNIVINQPGMRPGTPGSQITVPLSTLQGLQPGQGIPTGQAGHLLVKTEHGQYQILRVGSSTAPGQGGVATTISSGLTAVSAPLHTQQLVRPVLNATSQRQIIQTTGATSVSSAVTRTPTAVTGVTTGSGSSTTVGSGAGLNASQGQQMTPDTAKLKCKNFLATLLRLASEQPPNVANNVRELIQGLIEGRIEPEVFTNKLQKELNSSPQPCLVPFLKRSLPHLQQSLRAGTMTIEGVRLPQLASSSVAPGSHLGAAVRIPRPSGQVIGATGTTHQRPGVAQVVTGVAASSMIRHASPALPGLARGVTPTRPTMQVVHRTQPSSFSSPTVVTTVVGGISPKFAHLSQALPKASSTLTSTSQLVGVSSASSASGASASYSKKSSSTFAGDDDINDVAAMGGVNIAEESQRMQNTSDMIGSQVRSCKDETFLQTGLLHKRIAKICKDKGLEEPSADVIALMSHATQDRLKTLIEKLSIVSEHRMDVIKLEGDDYIPTQDVRGQLKFLGDLDRLERRRHEEAEREMLLRAAKSRTKTEDPEREKLKAKAKEMQRLEEEQLRHEKANNTALMAIGGPKKKLKLDEQLASGGKFGLSGASSVARPRTKRVNVRDLMFLMEQEKELKRSPLLWKAFLN